MIPCIKEDFAAHWGAAGMKSVGGSSFRVHHFCLGFDKSVKWY